VIAGIRDPVVALLERRGGASFANDPYPDQSKVNAFFVTLQGDVYAKVKKGCVIRPGDEILVDYTDIARVVMGIQ
jgi:hypothetical protein